MKVWLDSPSRTRPFTRKEVVEWARAVGIECTGAMGQGTTYYVTDYQGSTKAQLARQAKIQVIGFDRFVAMVRQRANDPQARVGVDDTMIRAERMVQRREAARAIIRNTLATSPPVQPVALPAPPAPPATTANTLTRKRRAMDVD